MPKCLWMSAKIKKIFIAKKKALLSMDFSFKLGKIVFEGPSRATYKIFPGRDPVEIIPHSGKSKKVRDGPRGGSRKSRPTPTSTFHTQWTLEYDG